jgi:hypothetical protein
MKLLPALARSSKQRRIDGKVLHVSFLCSDELTTSGSFRFLLAAEGVAFLGGAADRHGLTAVVGSEA